MSTRKSPIAVMGAGRMGRGIAHAFAYGGHPVTIVDFKQRPGEDFAQLAIAAKAEIESNLNALAREDIFPQSLIAEILALIRVVPLADAAAAFADAELVWEGVPERMDAKADALGRVSGMIAPEAIVASTTSPFRSPNCSATSRVPTVFSMPIFSTRPFLFPWSR